MKNTDEKRVFPNEPRYFTTKLHPSPPQKDAIMKKPRSGDAIIAPPRPSSSAHPDSQTAKRWCNHSPATTERRQDKKLTEGKFLALPKRGRRGVKSRTIMWASKTSDKVATISEKSYTVWSN